jgi:1-deoxy-D-xylulose-5-phosphate synthase
MLTEKDFPLALKKLSRTELAKLAQEIREKIIAVVTKNGGHLAASLGSVELAIALHTVLDTPKDKIIWDVGHQAYAHKLLTGRARDFHTLRQYKGISGFCKREESPYDTFTVGHASTSVSAAVGIARARDLNGEDFSVVSVIGDGAFSGGMVYEALNNSHGLKNFVVILNDNGMSISKPVGVIATMITKLRLSNLYTGLKHNTEKMLHRIPMIGTPLANVIERMVNRTAELIITEIGKKEYAGFFQDLGYTYMGPIDGHDTSMLMAAIKYAKNYKSPILLHIMTKKGKGHKPAEDDPSKYHGVPGLDPETGSVISKGTRSYTGIFSEELVRQAEQNEKICAISAAMCEGTGLKTFAEKYPTRFFDVGIAEEHAITFAGGLATEGLKPVVCLYSTFLQRGYDQIIHDVALQKVPVFFAIDRGGLVGDDGPTHHGVFDLSFLRTVPNLIVAAPADANELKDMVLTGLHSNQAFAVRYPRGAAYFATPEREAKQLTIGQAEVITGNIGASTVIWAIGTMVATAVALAKGNPDICVVNARWAKPIDQSLLKATAEKAKKIITMEENSIRGGFGAAICETLQELEITIPVEIKAIPDRFIEQGNREQLLRDLKLS